MRRLPLLTLFMLLLVSPISGCGRKEDPGKPKSKGTIGVSIMTSTNPFFNVIADNLRAELEPAGYEVLVVSGDQDIVKQKNQVKDFLVRKVAAIVLCPCDSQGIGTVIKEANDAGVPVFTADLKSSSELGKVTGHVATNNLEGGKEAGHAMIEALGEAGGKVIILDYKKAESCLERVRGFKEIIENTNTFRKRKHIDIVMELPGEGKREDGFKKTQDALQAHPDLAGIFAINDPSGLGAYAALESAKKTDQIKIIAFDGQPEGKKAVKEGKFYAEPLQYPDKIGKTTAENILKYFRGETINPDLPIATTLYRQRDAIIDETVK